MNNTWYLPLRPPSELTPPANLSGVSGTNRAPLDILTVPVKNDWEAALSFIDSLSNYSERTLKGYYRSVVRLFLWSWIVKNKPVSSLLYPDMKDFIEFCRDPQPRQFWCRSITLNLWKPFGRPFGDVRSAPESITGWDGVATMFQYWVNIGYVVGNPIGDAFSTRTTGTGGRPSVRRKAVAALYDVDDWMAVQKALDMLPCDTSLDEQFAERARFLFSIFFYLGATYAEIAQGHMNNFRKEGGVWFWHPIKTGVRPRPTKVWVHSEMLAALMRYRTFQRMSPLPAPDENVGLIFPYRSAKRKDLPTKSIAPSHYYTTVQRVAELAVECLPAHLRHKAPSLRKLKCWLVVEIGKTFRSQNGDPSQSGKQPNGVGE